MPIQKNRLILQKGIIVCLLLSLVLFTGCLSNPSNVNQSPSITPLNVPTVPTNESYQSYQPSKDIIISNPIQITVHNVKVHSSTQKSGKQIKLAVLDVSLKNERETESFSFDNTSLVCIESDGDTYSRINPNTEYLQSELKNPLLPCHLAPGVIQRGTVVFELVGEVDSIALYAKYPNWTILGDVYIADISKDLTSTANSGYSKNLEMVVHSAVQKKTIPGFNLREGSKIAIVNVSITNNNPADVTIDRENVFIMNERGSTLEHGGDRVTNEIARDYLRFPFIIKPGETITGPVIYVVSSGTRVNTLVVMDENYVINSVADLNTIYQYE